MRIDAVMCEVLLSQVLHTAATCVHCYRDIWIPPTFASIRPLTSIRVQTIRLTGGSDVAFYVLKLYGACLLVQFIALCTVTGQCGWRSEFCLATEVNTGPAT
jgi:hypothetical protein